MNEIIERATYKFFVEGLIKQTRAKNIMEIGLGAEGYGAKVCLDYISNQENGGKYIVLDFDPKPEAIKVLESYNKKLWELRIGDTQKNPELFQNCHDNRFDIILVDGSHWVTHIINDVQNCIINGCAKDDTLWIFHDSDSSHVMAAIRECSKIFNFHCFTIAKANLTLAKFLNH